MLPALNNDFTKASEGIPQVGPAKGFDFPKAVSGNGNITTMDMHDMNGTYSVGPSTTGLMVAIATKDYVFLYQPDWAARGGFEAYAYPRDGSGGSAVFPSGDTNTGDTKAGAAYLEAKEKLQQSLKELGPNHRFVVNEGGSVSGAELMATADAAFNEQTRWKADLEAKRARPQSPTVTPPPPSLSP